MHRVTSMLIAAAIVTVAALTWAGTYPERGPRAGVPPGQVEPLIRDVLRLKLSLTQKTDVATMLKKYRDKRGQEWEALRKAMDELAEVSYKQGASEDAVRSAYRAASAAGEPVALSRAKLVSELKRILTPEQTSQLDELRAERLAAKNSSSNQRRDGVSKWIDKNAR